MNQTTAMKESLARYPTAVYLLFWLGRPLAPVYALFMRLRAWLYRQGILRQRRLPALVISIGNLSLGGTGKTPMVQHVARLLLAEGLKPAIVSRGYGGLSRGQINVVSDGRGILLDAQVCGDEPRLLAETLPAVPVLTGKKRYVVARHALDRFSVDAIVLDDGFQHLGLARDLDLVLFHGDNLPVNARVLPGGDLREPLSALSRAHCLIITGVNDANRREVDSFKGYLQSRFPNRPVFTATHAPEPCLRKKAGQGLMDNFSLREAAALPVFGFCGIASPESFRRALEENSFKLADFKAFGDHHVYSEAELAALCEMARQAGARALITTEKDFVKLQDQPLAPDLPIYALKISLTLEDGFDRYLTERIRQIRGKMVSPSGRESNHAPA